VTFAADAGFIKVNVNQTGFYRVNYDLGNWHDIIAHLRSNPQSQVLSAGDRAGLLEDAFGLSSAGLLDTRVALNLSQYVKDEREYVPCRTALSQLSSMGGRLSLTPAYGLFQEFVRTLTSDLAEEFNFNRTNLTHLEIFLRSAVLTTAWNSGNSDVIDKATQLFQGWMRHSQMVAADLKSVVYPVGIAYGGEEEWDFVWEQYLASSDPYEKRLFLSALAQSRTPWILSRYLEYSVNSSKVRTQDTTTVISYISANVYGRYITWNFVRNNWDFLSDHFGGGSFSFSRLIKVVTSHFTTELELKEVESFFAEQPDLATGARAVRQATEIIRHNIQWLEANQDLVMACLQDTQTCFSSSLS
jgi:aminopeptidase N